MCGRFTLTWEEWRQVADALGVQDERDVAASYRPRFNIAQERDPLSLKRLLVPAPHDLLVMQPASSLVNSVKNEGPALLEFSEAATPE